MNRIFPENGQEPGMFYSEKINNNGRITISSITKRSRKILKA
jgi:hypothetical protein